VVVASSFVEAVEWELSSGGLPLEAYAIMTGRTVADAGTGTAETATMKIDAGDTFPYFILYGKSMGDEGDDVHVKLFKCKVTEGIDGSFSGGGFYVSSIKGMAVKDGANGVADIVRNETAVELPA
jgi:hypothetical protein